MMMIIMMTTTTTLIATNAFGKIRNACYLECNIYFDTIDIRKQLVNLPCDCLSVRLSVKASIVTKRKKVVPTFIYRNRMKDHSP